MSITVPSMEAYHMRRVLANCTGAGILRCIPQPQDSLVQMQVRLSADRVGEVMHQVMACMPSGQIGCISSWAEHLAKHGAPHGL
ncbi:MAG: hypothetical protein V4713_06385 [Pseudomonadota bacterium]